MAGRKRRGSLLRRSPDELTLRDAELAVGERAPAWAGRCYEIAFALAESGVVDGEAVYGHWLGPVARGTKFDRGAPFVQHGWVLLPDGRVLDPTRWVFEGRRPYLYLGPPDHYDEGGNRFRTAVSRPVPDWDPSEARFRFTKSVLPSAAWGRVESVLRLDRYYDDPEYEIGTVCLGQLFWLANLDPARLEPHAAQVYDALRAIGQDALIPIDNQRMVERWTRERGRGSKTLSEASGSASSPPRTRSTRTGAGRRGRTSSA